MSYADFINAAHDSLDVFGILGLILAIVSSQMPNRNLMMSVGLCGALCFAAHYARLGSYTGSVICLFAVLQGLLSAAFITPTHRPAWTIPVFVAILMAGFGITAMTWNGWASAFAVLGSVFATAARLQLSVERMRRLFLLMALCWLAHDVVMVTPVALLCEAFSVIGFVVAILREPRCLESTRYS